MSTLIFMPTLLRDWLALQPQPDWRALSVGLTLAAAAFETMVDLRQLACLYHPCPPAKLLPALSALRKSEDGKPATIFSKSQAYARAKQHLGFVSGAIGLVESLVMLLNVDKLWRFAVEALPPKYQTAIPCSMSFIVLTSALGMITSLPMSYYKTFVLEERFGFNKSTRKTWVVDQVKGVVLGAAIGLPLSAAALWIINRFGASFVQYLMGFLLAVQIVAVPAYPYLIAPLFNKFTALSTLKEHSRLQQLIESLARRLGFPLGKVWVIDGSTRSAHSNAYFTGVPFLTKHIVLYDTLLKDQTPEEVEAVLAHEMGHWKNKDPLRMIFFSQTQVFLTLSIYRYFLFNKDMYKSFGIQPSSAWGSASVPILIGFTLAGALLSPLDTILSFITNAFSRRLEFAADQFAAEQGYTAELKNALINMMAKNSSIFDIDPYYSAMHHSHPTLSERIARLDTLQVIDKQK